MLRTNETTHETTTTSPAHWWRRYLCPDCTDIAQTHPVELETDDGEVYMCPECGCWTTAPEEDACPEIRDAWAEALTILEEEGAEVIEADGNNITIERRTADLGCDMVHELTLTDREDAEEIARAFGELYQEFDPWREAHLWLDEEGTPREGVPTSYGPRVWEDMKQHGAWLHNLRNRVAELRRSLMGTTAARIVTTCAEIERAAQASAQAWAAMCEAAGLGVDVLEVASARWIEAHPGINPASEEAQELATTEDPDKYYPTAEEVADMCLADVSPLDLAEVRAGYAAEDEEEREAGTLAALVTILDELTDK